MPAFFRNYKKIGMEEPVIYINPQKAHDLDRHLALQKLYYRPEGLYQNIRDYGTLVKKPATAFHLLM